MHQLSKLSEEKLIGVLEFAALLKCHPASIPKFIKDTKDKKKNFPLPKKLFGKNFWPERVALAYRDKLLSGKAA